MVEPGVSREQRISEEGLQRLEKQLRLGIRINTEVLKQWVRRYGDAARDLLKKYDCEIDD
jgi:hypothetical protein